jgi:hypothetical protein
MSEMPTAALRAEVHAVLDPIWMSAVETGGYTGKRLARLRRGLGRGAQKVARERVYAWLAERMWLTEEECHVSRFTVEQCDAAIHHLRGATYADIRTWAHARDHRTLTQARMSAAARGVSP